jgi:hypothetical protein
MRSVLVTAAVVLMMVGVVAPVSADSNGASQIDGGGLAIGDPAAGSAFGCEDRGVFTLLLTSGSRRGCWYTDVIPEDSIQFNPSGTYQERGEETFVGEYWVDGVKVGEGEFSTTYHFTAKFAPDGAEIFGRCQHPIVEGSGTGVFEGAKGRVDFKDVDPANGILEYRGHV